eukprot:UN01274
MTGALKDSDGALRVLLCIIIVCFCSMGVNSLLSSSGVVPKNPWWIFGRVNRDPSLSVDEFRFSFCLIRYPILDSPSVISYMIIFVVVRFLSVEILPLGLVIVVF